MSKTVPYQGPTDCGGLAAGNYQHQNWNCENNVPTFNVTGFITTSGDYELIPAGQRYPGATPPVLPGTTIVENGTLWVFDPETGFTDTGKKAQPLVVIDSSGKVTSPGYNPGTGGWQIGQNADGSAVYGVAPDNAKKVPGAFDQLQAAVSSLGALLKSGQPG